MNEVLFFKQNGGTTATVYAGNPMKISWTFYPKGESAITLTIVYLPELDGRAVQGGGILHVAQNTAFVDWATFKRFDDASVDNRKDAYGRLTRLDEMGEDTVRQLILSQH